MGAQPFCLLTGRIIRSARWEERPMILSPKIAAALDGPDAGAPPCDVTIEEGAHQLTLHLTASGPVGLAFGAMDYRNLSRPEWTAESLKAWGERIASRVT